MQGAKPVLLIRPMTMSDFFPSQPGAGSAEARAAEKAVRKSLRGRRRRFAIWLAVMILCAGSARAAVSYGPAVLKRVAPGLFPSNSDDSAAAKANAVALAEHEDEEAAFIRATAARASSESNSSSSNEPSSQTAFPTPEPSSLILFAIGGLAIGGFAIRKRRANLATC